MKKLIQYTDGTVDLVQRFSNQSVEIIRKDKEVEEEFEFEMSDEEYKDLAKLSKKDRKKKLVKLTEKVKEDKMKKGT